MSLSVALAERALAPPGAREREHLRTLTLTNVAAAAGARGSAAPLVEHAATGPDVPAERARYWAMALHARTQDDFYPHGRVHVGALALATTLALADAAGERLYACLAAGYDVMCRSSGAYSAEAQRRGMRPSGFFGPLGSAAAASVALGLDVHGSANAIGLAATMSAGTNQAWLSGTDEWLLEVGAAARAGVEAATLTVAGAKASSEALEGGAGWARAFFDDDGASRLAEQVERDDSGLLEVATKPYPVSGIAEVPTWLACAAHADAPPDAVEVGVSEIESAYPGSANRGPFRSRSDALMSIAFCVSCGLADGLVRLERLERPNDPRLAALLERVAVVPTAELAEEEFTLTVEAGGARQSTRATGAEVLYPAWDELDAAALAARSEASAEVVADARRQLMRDAPAVTSLHDLLKGAQCRVESKQSSAASTS